MIDRRSFATMTVKGEEGMNWIATNTWGKSWRRVWSVTFVVFVTMLLAAPSLTFAVRSFFGRDSAGARR